MDSRYPRVALWILRRMLSGRELESIEHDICDEYDRFVRHELGRLRAKVWFWNQTVRSVLHRRSLRGGLDSLTVTGISGDIRYGFRSCRRRPASSLMVISILAVSIGANALMLSVSRATLFPEMEFVEPERLVYVWTRTASEPSLALTQPALAPWIEERVASFDDVAFASRVTDNVITSDETARPVSVARITADFFSVLGVAPVQGRQMADSDVPIDGDSLLTIPVMVSEQVWRGFVRGSDLAALRLDGVAIEVVGVIPSEFDLPVPDPVREVMGADVWRLIAINRSVLFRDNGRLLDRDSDDGGVIVGRLAAGVDLEMARSEVKSLAANELVQLMGSGADAHDIVVNAVLSDARADVVSVVSILWIAVALVLIVGAGNAGGLLMSRTLTRGRELAVRTALGATPTLLVRQLFIESALLVGAGATIGWVGAYLGAESIAAVAGLPTASVKTFGLPAALGMASLLVVTLLVAALGPALRSFRFGRSRSLALRTSARTLGGSWFHVAQIGASTVLIIVAIGLWRTVNNLRAVDPGFDVENVVAFDAVLRNRIQLRGPADRSAAVYEIERELLAIPRVERVGLVGRLPLSGRVWTQPYGDPGAPVEEWLANSANFRVVTHGAFDALGIGLIAGRTFDRFDDRQDRRVVVIDSALANRLAPTGSAVGQLIGIPLDGDAVVAEIVGVVEDVRYESLRRDSRPTIYVPYRHEASRDVSFVVKTNSMVGDIAGDIRAAVSRAVPVVGVTGIRNLGVYVERSQGRERVVLRALTVFAALAVGLTAYALLALGLQEVSRRRVEFGIRVALGVPQGALVATALRPTCERAVIGLAIGVAGTVAVHPIVSTLLYGVDLLNPLALLLGLGIVLGVVVATALGPALGAAHTDPVTALRSD